MLKSKLNSSKWIKNFQSVVDNGRGHEITIDLPKAKDGDDTGATALELAVLESTSCNSSSKRRRAVRRVISFKATL